METVKKAKRPLRRCKVCGGTWRPYSDKLPRRCGLKGCNSPYWNTGYTRDVWRQKAEERRRQKK